MDVLSGWWLLAVGLIGQGFFFMRVFRQRVVSKKEAGCVIPESLWYCSLFGSFFVLAYAVLRRDMVFAIGQSMGTAIYVRNLYLIHRERRRLQTAG